MNLAPTDRPTHTIQIINPDFNISFKSSLNLSYVCFFELAKRDLLYRWRSLPGFTFNKIAYDFATTIRHKELTEFANKIANLPAKQEGAPLLNLLSVWEQHRTDSAQIAESIREYILLLIDYRQPSIARLEKPPTKIPVYHSYRSVNSKWRTKKNVYADRIDQSIRIIKRMVRVRDLAKSTGELYVTNLSLWADLTDQKLTDLGNGMAKLANHPKLSKEDSTIIESASHIIITGEIKRIAALSKKDYTMEDTFLGNITKPAIDPNAAKRGLAKLNKLRARLKTQEQQEQDNVSD